VEDSVVSYSRSYRERVSVVYNGVPEPSVASSRDETRRRWKLPLEAAVLVNVGRFSTQKNQEFLIRLLETNKDLHLLLVGDGELHDSLRRLPVEVNVEDRVHFTGEVGSNEVSSLISCSDILVLPSLFEAVGLVVLEAMMLGKPVVSNDIPSSREFIGEDGILVDIASPEKWLSAIQTLLDRPELVAAMVLRAKNRVRRFSVSRMADGYEEKMMPMRFHRLAESDE